MERRKIHSNVSSSKVMEDVAQKDGEMLFGSLVQDLKGTKSGPLVCSAGFIGRGKERCKRKPSSDMNVPNYRYPHRSLFASGKKRRESYLLRLIHLIQSDSKCFPGTKMSLPSSSLFVYPISSFIE